MAAVATWPQLAGFNEDLGVGVGMWVPADESLTTDIAFPGVDEHYATLDPDTARLRFEAALDDTADFMTITYHGDSPGLGTTEGLPVIRAGFAYVT